MRGLVLFVVGLVGATMAQAQSGSIYADTPELSQIPTDGAPVELTLLFELPEQSPAINFFHWEVEAVGDIVIEGWIGRTSATCRSTPDGCTLQSDTEFLGTVHARLFGSGGRGATGFTWQSTPMEVGTLTVAATGPGFLRVKIEPGNLDISSETDIAIALGQCNDGADNDGDQSTDGDDPECVTALVRSEAPDSDGDGIADAVDPFPSQADHQLAQCEQDLGSCPLDRDACVLDLASASADLGACQDDLVSVTDTLSLCETDLSILMQSIALVMSLDPTAIPMGCGIGSFPCVGGRSMNVGLLSGFTDPLSTRFLFEFSGLSGAVEDLLGLGFTADPLPGVGRQLHIREVRVVASSLDTFELPNPFPVGQGSTSFLLRIIDADGLGSAVLEVIVDHIDSAGLPSGFPRDVFFSNTGAFESPPSVLAQFGSQDLDPDDDGVITDIDNCPGDSNPLQEDADLDLIGDACDLCPEYPSTGADFDGNGIGDECECGDQTMDGVVNITDLLAINDVIFGAVSASPLCDTNHDGLCNVADILGANAKLFGAPAYCERYPPPTP